MVPEGIDYPRDREGHPLILPARINVAETPRLAPFPDAGLLQIFIARDGLYGCTFCDATRGDAFARIFCADTSAPAAVPIDPAFDRSGSDSPPDGPIEAIALTLSLSGMPVDSTDYWMERLLPKIFNDETGLETYHDERQTLPIRLGGYPNFTQQDPHRYNDTSTIGDFNLLTIDTTDGIMWGAAGVAQYFMREDDLRRRHSSKVNDNWNCC